MAETFEAALWYNAGVPEEKETARRGLEETFLRTGVLHSVTFGPIEYEDVGPEDERLLPPPAQMTGNVRCLIATAETSEPLKEEAKITQDLTDEDRIMLRRVTRRAFHKAGGPPLTDQECDQLIDEHGTEVIREELMQ